jgi:hypothetical protein
MTEITAPLPAGTIAATVRDAEWRGAQVGLPRPLMSYTDVQVTTLTWRYPDGTELDPALVALWSAAVGTPGQVTPWQNQTAIEQQLAAAMAAMQTILDTADIPAGTLTTAQVSNHVRALQTAVKAEARLLRRLVRAIRADYTGSD